MSSGDETNKSCNSRQDWEWVAGAAGADCDHNTGDPGLWHGIMCLDKFARVDAEQHHELSHKISLTILRIIKHIQNNFKDFNNSKGFLKILSNSNVSFFWEKGFSPKKGPCGKMHTRQIILCIFFEKSPPRGKMQTRQKMFYGFSFVQGKDFLRITNFQIWQLYLSSGKTATSRTHFSC